MMNIENISEDPLEEENKDQEEENDAEDEKQQDENSDEEEENKKIEENEEMDDGQYVKLGPLGGKKNYKNSLEFYKFYEISQYGSEIVERFEIVKDTNYAEFINIRKGTIRKIDPETRKSRYEFIFLIDLDLFESDPFVVPYVVFRYFEAEHEMPILRLKPREDAWCFAVFVSLKKGVIMKTSLKLLFYLSRANIDLKYLQLHQYETNTDVSNFLKIWDEASDYAFDTKDVDHYIDRFKLCLFLEPENIFRFIQQFPGFLSDHICELFLVRAYDSKNYEKLIEPGTMKQIIDKLDTDLFNEMVPALLNPENLSLWIDHSTKDFVSNFLELIKLKSKIESKTPYEVCLSCKNSDCSNCKYKVVYFPLHIWKNSMDVYLKWKKINKNNNIDSKYFQWTEFLNAPAFFDDSYYVKNKDLVESTEEKPHLNIGIQPRTWKEVDKFGYRPDFRLYDCPRIDKKVSPFEGRIFNIENYGAIFHADFPKFSEFSDFEEFYSDTFGIEYLSVLPPGLNSTAVFYYYKTKGGEHIQDIEEYSETEDTSNLKKHFIIVVNKNFPDMISQELDARAMKMLFYNNDMSNIELFYFDTHHISKINLEQFSEYRFDAIKYYESIGKILDVVLDMQNRGWNFDLLFEYPTMKILSYHTINAVHTWLMDDETGEYVDPFTPEELDTLKKLENMAQYIREIKLNTIEKTQPEFYAKLVKWYGTDDSEDYEDEDVKFDTEGEEEEEDDWEADLQEQYYWEEVAEKEMYGEDFKWVSNCNGEDEEEEEENKEEADQEEKKGEEQ